MYRTAAHAPSPFVCCECRTNGEHAATTTSPGSICSATTCIIQLSPGCSSTVTAVPEHGALSRHRCPPYGTVLGGNADISPLRFSTALRRPQRIGLSFARPLSAAGDKASRGDPPPRLAACKPKPAIARTQGYIFRPSRDHQEKPRQRGHSCGVEPRNSGPVRLRLQTAAEQIGRVLGRLSRGETGGRPVSVRLIRSHVRVCIRLLTPRDFCKTVHSLSAQHRAARVGRGGLDEGARTAGVAAALNKGTPIASGICAAAR